MNSTVHLISYVRTGGTWSVWPEDRAIFQYFAIYNNENMPSSLKIAKVGTIFLPNTK